MISIYDAQVKAEKRVPNVSGYYDRANMMASPRTPTNHYHPACEIMYVTNGAMAMTVQDSSLILGRRQYIFLDSAVPHKIGLESPGDSSMMNIEFTMEPSPVLGSCDLYKTDAHFAYMLDHPLPYFVLTDHDQTVYHLLKKAVLIAGDEQGDASQICALITMQLLGLIARQRHQTAAQQAAQIGNPYVENALFYMHAHYAEPITAIKTAQALHIQPTYLHRLIRRHTGQTYTQLLSSIRLTHAKTLLRQTSLSILRIAGLTGFSSPQYFSKLFVKQEGITPMSYRKKHSH